MRTRTHAVTALVTASLLALLAGALGLYADWVADVLQVAGAEAADREAELMRGAESYVQMWEGAHKWQS